MNYFADFLKLMFIKSIIFILIFETYISLIQDELKGYCIYENIQAPIKIPGEAKMFHGFARRREKYQNINKTEVINIMPFFVAITTSYVIFYVNRFPATASGMFTIYNGCVIVYGHIYCLLLFSKDL